MTFALGIAAALVAPFMMVMGFIIWDNHWSGSAFSLNMYKCNLAAIGFAAVSITSGHMFAAVEEEGVFTREKVGFLMLSSTIGILIGDWTWLEGMRVLGATKIIAIDSLKPFLAALLGEVFLAERLQPAACVGLVLTVLGVTLVGLEKETNQEDNSVVVGEDATAESDRQKLTTGQLEIGAAITTETNSLLPKPMGKKETKRLDSYAEQRKSRSQSTQEIAYGLMMGISNVVLHTFGALLTKQYGKGMTTFEINLIRFGFAGVCMLLLSISMGLNRATGTRGQTSAHTPELTSWYSLPSLKRSSWIRVILGVGFVSFLTPALTNYAMFEIPLALLLTLESTGPLHSLPLSLVLQKEQPSMKACFGAFLAVAGIVILSFKGTMTE